MKTTTIAILGLLLMVSLASAHGDSGRFGGMGDFGFGGFRFGDFGGGYGGFGGDFGLGFSDPARTQTRFETRFDSLKTQYDTGVASGTDFFTSTDYDNILNKTELLTDRYGLFVSGVTRSIDRLTDVISTTNDDLTYYNNLLATYQADTTLSATRLARIEDCINRITDRLDSRITSLTDKQTTLQTDLPTYQSFQTDLTTFLTDITAAGGGTSGSPSSVKSLFSGATAAFSMTAVDSTKCGSTSSPLSPGGAVPEPTSALLVVLASGAILMRRRRREFVNGR